MTWLVLAPFAVQTVAIAVDEFWFHYRRTVPRWERIGHPLDTLTALACYAWILLVPPAGWSIAAYIALAVFSSVFITKDEFVHAKYCPPAELWLHAVLFVFHPIVLAAAGAVWPLLHGGSPPIPVDPTVVRVALYAVIAGSAGFLLYQFVYWNVLCTRTPR